MMRSSVAAIATLIASGVDAQDPPRLSLPLACEPGRTCFIQHYVDIDPGPGVSDFRCGSATYEGHKGVDFRVLSAAAARRSVPVLAAAPGVVKGSRDGMADAFARETGKAGITDRECGNGVVIDHGGGWETQYCHMRQGSLKVKRGDRIERGQPLGDIGWSGLADFAHLHLSVRKDGQVIDPFTGQGQTSACKRDGAEGSGLWDARVPASFPYRNGEIFDVGFAEREPAWAALEEDHENGQRPSARSPALLLYARIANVREGDRVRLLIQGPGGLNAKIETEAIPRNRAIHLAFGGQRLRGAAWPSGQYTGTAELVRNGTVISQRSGNMELR